MPSMVTCWERAGLLAPLCVFCVFVAFPYGVLGKMWYLIVWIPDLCLLPYLSFLLLLSFKCQKMFELLFCFIYYLPNVFSFIQKIIHILYLCLIASFVLLDLK